MKLGAKTKKPQVLICYDLMEGLIDEEEDLIFETKLELFSFGTIILLEEMVSFFNVGLSKIRTIEEFDPKGRTSYQTVVELEPLTIKSEDVCVRLEVSLEDKVYVEPYYTSRNPLIYNWCLQVFFSRKRHFITILLIVA
jgi:hypothetical protein